MSQLKIQDFFSTPFSSFSVDTAFKWILHQAFAAIIKAIHFALNLSSPARVFSLVDSLSMDFRMLASLFIPQKLKATKEA